MSTPGISSKASGAGDRHQTWTIVLAGLGIFMTALDNLVVATALPVVRVDLHASLSALEWTLNAYLLAFACLIQLALDLLGQRPGRSGGGGAGTRAPQGKLRSAVADRHRRGRARGRRIAGRHLGAGAREHGRLGEL